MCIYFDSFNLSHTLSYSIVGLQEMNLAYHYPVIYWNTANLIVDSSSAKNDENNQEKEIEIEKENIEEEQEEEEEEEIVSIFEEEDFENYEYEDLPDRSGKIKKQKKTVDYGKISKAISRFKKYGINVLPPHINTSRYTFTPDEKANTITYGLKGITRVSDDLIKEIIEKRPYNSLEDFQNKVKVNKLQMINLIKSGAFDELDDEKDRKNIMKNYIVSISDQKKDLNLRNMQGLINYEVLDEETEKYAKLFAFTKFLKKHKDGENYIVESDKALNYLSELGNIDMLISTSELPQKKWDKWYNKEMDGMRAYIKENKEKLLEKLNNKLFMENWDKYCKGTISKWEMNSIGFYYHEHELANFASKFVNFYNLPEDPIVNKTFQTKNGQTIVMYELSTIAGVVVNKDKTHSSISLLTPDGLVNVKIYKQQWPTYDRQISMKNPDGTKTVLESSWLNRGNLLIIQGIRRGNDFIPKKYKSSTMPVITKINGIGQSLDLQFERMEA